MRVLAIIGSPRKKNCYQFSKKIEEEINKKEKCEFEYLFLNEVNLEFCRGCGICKKEAHCIINDDWKIIDNKIKTNELLLLISPVYVYNCTGLMKNFIDRFHYYNFFPFINNKFSIIITLAAYSGLLNTSNYLNFVFHTWGIRNCNIDIIVQKYHSDNIYKQQIDNKLKNASNDLLLKKLKKPTSYELFIFQEQKEFILFNKERYGEAYNYWQSNKILNQYYFYDVRINFFQRLFSILKGYKIKF